MKIQEKNYNLNELLKPYADKWVALTQDYNRVVAYGNNLKEVVSKSKSKDVVFLKV